MTVIGVDPGLRGGIVALDGQEVVLSEVMPVLKVGKSKKVIDIVRFISIIRDLNPSAIALESQQAMPKQGLSSTFKTGRQFGQLEGVCYTMKVRFEVVRATAWTKEILKGVEGDGKERAIRYIQRRLPGLDLTPGMIRKPHDGLADAACIALWMQRRYNEENGVKASPEKRNPFEFVELEL
jgi:crossover junction endodeoxyribonuclease RuvC